MEAMKSDVDEVALQGIEFWSNVCDEEVDLAIEASEVPPIQPLSISQLFNPCAVRHCIPVYRLKHVLDQ